MAESDHPTIDAGGEPAQVVARRYRVIGLVGRGGMGEVLRAWDERLERDVALKVLRRELVDTPEHFKRFEREAQALARLQHPNVLTVLDFVEGEDGRLYQVLEYVAGGSLADRLVTGPLAWNECVRVGEQVCDALTAAHQAGIVHRDIKPSNILLEPDGRVRVADFGIARVATNKMTKTGTVLGTPGYMAPEQAMGHRATPQSDIYCLCAVLFETACGRAPYVPEEQSTPTQLAVMHLALPVPDPRGLNSALPVGASALIMRGLRKDPHDRFADIGELRAALSASRDMATPIPKVVEAEAVAVRAPETMAGAGLRADSVPSTIASATPVMSAEDAADPTSRLGRTRNLSAGGLVVLTVLVGGTVLVAHLTSGGHPRAAGSRNTGSETAGSSSPPKGVVAATSIGVAFPSRIAFREIVPVWAKVTSQPGVPAGTCFVERHIAGQTERIAAGGVSRTGVCRMTIRIGRRGTEQLRVRFRGSAGFAGSVSPYTTVSVR